MLFRIINFVLVFALSGCFGGGNYAPVVERQERVKVIPNTHVVSRSETLYSIAWRYNKDFRELADANNIAAPYTIYPGQRLIVKPLSRNTSDGKPSQRVTASRQISPRSNQSTKRVQKTTAEESPNAIGMWDKNRFPFRWQWPANGRLLTRYSAGSAVHKGIDIQGKLGEPVHAANSGKVVYAGSGLVGYGMLLIIKHDEHYLSAYGHNRRLLVNEGEMIKVGQQIAEFGDTGTDRVKLHFEIRRDGQPINPLSLLPRG